MNEPVGDPLDEASTASDDAEGAEATAEPAQDNGDPDAVAGEPETPAEDAGEASDDGAAPDAAAEEAAAPNIRLLNDDDPAEDAGASVSPPLLKRLPLSLSDWQQAQRWAHANGRTLAVAGVVVVVLFWSWMTWSLVGSVAAIDRSVEALTAEVAGQTAGASLLVATPATTEEAAAEPEAAAAVASEATPEPTPQAEATPEPTPTVVATPLPPAQLFGKLVVTNGADLWNCSDFETWEQAKRVYDANLPNDPNLIDFDRNGVPCESLLPS